MKHHELHHDAALQQRGDCDMLSPRPCKKRRLSTMSMTAAAVDFKQMSSLPYFQMDDPCSYVHFFFEVLALSQGNTSLQFQCVQALHSLLVIRNTTTSCCNIPKCYANFDELVLLLRETLIVHSTNPVIHATVLKLLLLREEQEVDECGPITDQLVEGTSFVLDAMEASDDVVLLTLGLHILQSWMTVETKSRSSCLPPELWQRAARTLSQHVLLVSTNSNGTATAALHGHALAVLACLVEIKESSCCRWVSSDGILQAMQAHRQDATVQCYAAATLCWIFHHQNGERRIPSGLPDLIANALEIDDPSVFINCVCLLSVTRMPEQHFDRVQSGLERYQSNPNVAKTVLRWMLALQDQTPAEHFPTALSLVLDLLPTHENDTTIAARGCHVLARLAEQDLDQVLESSAADVVLQCMHTSSCGSSTYAAAAYFLGLAGSAPGMEAFGGGIEVVESILQYHQQQTNAEETATTGVHAAVDGRT